MAVRRGQFEMSCPAATGEMLARETLQPLVQTFRFSSPERAENSPGAPSEPRRPIAARAGDR